MLNDSERSLARLAVEDKGLWWLQSGGKEEAEEHYQVYLKLGGYLTWKDWEEFPEEK